MAAILNVEDCRREEPEDVDRRDTISAGEDDPGSHGSLNMRSFNSVRCNNLDSDVD
jgi:hypothetical protein